MPVNLMPVNAADSATLSDESIVGGDGGVDDAGVSNGLGLAGGALTGGYGWGGGYGGYAAPVYDYGYAPVSSGYAPLYNTGYGATCVCN